jgi:hypothetical protein
VSCPSGEAKFWVDPEIAVSQNSGLSKRQINEIHKVIEERINEITKAWKKHFRS